MKSLRTLLFNLSFYATTLFLALLSVPVSFIGGNGPVRSLYGVWCRSVVWLVRHVLGATVEIRGLERLNGEIPALLVSKHHSELDVALMGAIFPQYGAVAMRELDKYPLVGGIVSKLGHIKVSVSGNRANQLPEVLDGAKQVHAEGRPILIYPEGTLMEPGRKLRYRGGVWHVYNALGVPATPVALSLSLVWPQRKWEKHKARCGMEFLEPIPPGLEKREFMAELERRIETGSNALIREHATPEVLEKLVFDYEVEGSVWAQDRHS